MSLRPGRRRTADIDIVRTVAALRETVAAWRAAGETVAFVPTMGGIHAGHLSLVHAARKSADRVAISLFVNPRQFGANEDFASYPAHEAEDAAALLAAGSDAIYAPGTAAIYPEGFATTVSVADLTAGLCGPHRPGHFDGVATIVAKLLLQCGPDRALFGEKDFQQLQVIRRLVRDLDIPVEILGVPTVRDPDGLALSSRNAYLNEAERRAAPVLFRTLSALAETVAEGKVDCRAAAKAAEEELLAAGFSSVDYVAVCDAEALAPVDRVAGKARVFGAARLGATRLIDNLPVPHLDKKAG